RAGRARAHRRARQAARLLVRRARPGRVPLGLAQRGAARRNAGPAQEELVKGVVIAALALLALAAPAAADSTYVPKKDRERAAKSKQHPPPPRPGTKPAKLINLYNRWTNDWLAVDPTNPPSLAQINTFLRDHFTNEAREMEPRLLAAVIKAANQFKSDVVDVVSGFRHPKYNLMLRKKGRQVARNSQHTHG